MKILCKTLAYIELILGSIGSIILAYTLGIKFDYGTLKLERDSTATFAIFVSTILCVITIWGILCAISEILENQEKIFQILGETKKTDTKSDNISISLPLTPPQPPIPLNPQIHSTVTRQESANTVTDTEEWKLYDAWKCPNCKRINEGSDKSCVCGVQRKHPD